MKYEQAPAAAQRRPNNCNQCQRGESTPLSRGFNLFDQSTCLFLFFCFLFLGRKRLSLRILVPLCKQRRLVQGFLVIVLEACLFLHCALYSNLFKMTSAVCCYQHDSHGCIIILRGTRGGRVTGRDWTASNGPAIFKRLVT